MPSQNEYNVAKQNGRVIHTKIYLLNYQLQKVDEISGIVLDGATFNIDATSDIRRTCSISLIPTDASFDIKFGGKIWLDKYVQIYIGIEDNRNNGEIVYTNMGIYLINNPSQTYSAVNNTITINGIDLMAKLTGLRDGYFGGDEQSMATDMQTPKHTNIKEAISTILKECGFEKSVVELDTIPETTNESEYVEGVEYYDPYDGSVVYPFTLNDIAVSIGGTYYQILSELANVNTNRQMYFDENGVFYYNKIPSGYNEPIRVDDDLWKDVLISYDTSVSFEDVKNVIEVFGKTLDDGSVPYGIAMETNEESPFYIEGNLGKINIVLTGGEYDNITDINGQAQERAEYELYLRCRLQDQITINCVPIYWLDVNWLVEITLPNKQGTEETHQYIIKSINTTLGVNGTQSISMMRYYPLYPEYDNNGNIVPYIEDDDDIPNPTPSTPIEPIEDIVAPTEPIENIEPIGTIKNIEIKEKPIETIDETDKAETIDEKIVSTNKKEITKSINNIEE